ncbi:DddA-like double-stranded DNA deaminase toxin [Amycolatopsis pigmentata]|uniref:DddA-like double-stranded DNA deaminase toxin n=1 Tax=Amycolatopsis pigmentata TaxID=450801 RepID=A0ABW5G129_9PSEU
MPNSGGGCVGKVTGWTIVVVLLVVLMRSCGVDLGLFSSSACDAPTAAGSLAFGDSGDCEKLKRAAIDPSWAAQQRQRSELRNGKVTTSLFFETSPESYTALSSGHDDLSEQAASILTDAGYSDIDPDPATHAEVKVAVKMREDEAAFGVLVINNTYVCGQSGPMGCRDAVAVILPEGATLYIWTKNARQVLAIKGRGS